MAGVSVAGILGILRTTSMLDFKSPIFIGMKPVDAMITTLGIPQGQEM
jgi:hypothetical protein